MKGDKQDFQDLILFILNKKNINKKEISEGPFALW